jgi:hypothetical protein
VTFPVPSFTRASIATFVNSQGLIEIAPADTPRFEYDPVTGAPKGLLLEEARTNLVLQSRDLSHVSWVKVRVALTTTTNFPIFAEMPVFLMAGTGAVGDKYVYRTFSASSNTRTFSVFLRAGTGVFAQIIGGNDNNSFANFNLATGVVGSRGTSISSSTIQLWKDNWFRCTFTTASSVVGGFGICLITSATSVRTESNSLTTSIYLAGPQMEVGAFATSYIPTTTAAVTRAADDFEEVLTPFPSMSDALGSGVTTSHIGHPLSGAECAAMARLNIEGPTGGLRDWGAELLFTP